MVKADFSKLKGDLESVLDALGIGRDELEDLIEDRAKPLAAETKKIVTKISNLASKTRKLIESHELSKDERKRQIDHLELQIKVLKLGIPLERDRDRRKAMRLKLTRLLASQGTLKSASVFSFSDLVHPEEEEELRDLLEDADQEIKARHDLARVLKGVELLMRVAVFGAAVASKVALK